MSSARSHHHQMRLHLWSGMALLALVLLVSLACAESRATSSKSQEPDDEVQDDTSDYLDDGELNAALTGAAAPSHHHHIHVHPKAGAKTTRKPSSECDCSKNNKTVSGASRTSPVDPLEDFTTTSSTTTTTTVAPDDTGGGSPEDEDLTDDYLEETESTPAPAGKSRAADDLDEGPSTTSAKPSIMSVPDEANTTVASTTETPATAKPAITIKPIQLEQSAGGADDDAGDS